MRKAEMRHTKFREFRHETSVKRLLLHAAEIIGFQVAAGLIMVTVAVIMALLVHWAFGDAVREAVDWSRRFLELNGVRFP
jgi:hypothetical protein